MKKLTRKQKVDRNYNLADSLENHMDQEGLCCHEQAKVWAVGLSSLLRGAMEHNGVEAVDDILTTFVNILDACTDPYGEDDPMAQLKISLKIETNEEGK
jgi:hypothetical protein